MPLRPMALLDLPAPQKLPGQVTEGAFVGAAPRVGVEDGGVDEEGVEESEGPVCRWCVYVYHMCACMYAWH